MQPAAGVRAAAALLLAGHQRERVHRQLFRERQAAVLVRVRSRRAFWPEAARDGPYPPARRCRKTPAPQPQLGAPPTSASAPTSTSAQWTTRTSTGATAGRVRTQIGGGPSAKPGAAAEGASGKPGKDGRQRKRDVVYRARAPDQVVRCNLQV